MDETLLAALAERIRAAREHAGLTQTALAVACGWTHGGRIGNYEQGIREPSLTDLESIADATGVRYAWLVAGNGPMAEGRRVADKRAAYPQVPALLSPEEAAHLENWRALPPKMREHIKALSDAVAKSDVDDSAAS